MKIKHFVAGNKPADTLENEKNKVCFDDVNYLFFVSQLVFF